MRSLSIPNGVMDFATLRQVAQGRERTVFVCDAYPDLVFKMQKPVNERELKKRDMKSFLLKRIAGFDHFIVRQEYKAYVKMCLSQPDLMTSLPVARMYGFVPSTRGVLQVAEKVSLDGQSLGPTFREVGRDPGFTAHDIAALNRFAKGLRNSRIPTNDINTNNIVKGLDENGQARFVLIDGIGDLQVLPVKTYSQRAREAHLAKMFDRMCGRNVAFDATTFTFAFRPDT